MIHTHSLLSKSIQKIEAQWRFTPSKLPLLCKIFKLISKFGKFIPKLPTYHVSRLPFFNIFQKIPFLKFPDSITSSHQIVFTQLIQQKFWNKLSSSLMGQKVTSVWGLRSGSLLFHCHFFFPSISCGTDSYSQSNSVHKRKLYP